MQCPACNEAVPNDVSSCPECGAQLSGGAGGSQASQAGQPQHGGQPHPTSAQGQDPQQAPAAPNEGAGTHTASPQSQQGGGYQQRPPGPPLSTQARTLLSELPWRGGIIAGVVIYVFGFAALAVLTTGVGSEPEGLSIAAELFLGIVSFVSPSDLVVQVITPGQDTSQALLSGRYDGLLGLLYMVVPALLYLTGRKFTEWNATEQDGVELYLATGATVVFGTLPAAIGLAVLVGANVVQSVLIAGLVVPGLAGVFGGTMAWVFRDNARTASYGAGVFIGLLGYALVFVYILSTASALLSATSGGLLLVGLAAVFVVVNVTSFAIGAGGFVGFLLVTLPVVGLGYFRASRGPDDIGDVLEGARAGASILAGFSSFVFVPVAIYALLTSPAGADVTGGNMGLVFGPQAAAGITLITSPAALLQTFLLAGVVFPMVFGGIGGAIAGYVASNAGARRPTSGPQAGSGGQPRQPRQQGGHDRPRQPQENAPVQGQGQTPAQSPRPAQGSNQPQSPDQSGPQD